MSTAPVPIEGASPLIFISAAEPSADLHGAGLIRATLQRCPSARFVGVAGPRMVEAGCWPIFDMTRHSAMLLGAVGAAGKGIRMLATASSHLRRYPFHAAVVIDSPMLHLPLAMKAKEASVPVLYYIAPQLWAWGASRIHKLRDRVERLAVILPFEEDFFRERGVEAEFVGHPLVDQMPPAGSSQPPAVKRHGEGPFVTLLPGSRKHVVQEVFGGQLEVAEAILRAFPNARFGVSTANDQVSGVIASELRGKALPIETHAGPPADLIKAADLVLVASGTTTLEVALHARPMIVMYNASRAFYHLVGRWMIKTPHLSLPNILAGREIVPEFMPYYRSTEPIAERAIELLRSEDDRNRMVEALKEVTAPLHGRHAAQNTARLLMEMIESAKDH